MIKIESNFGIYREKTEQILKKMVKPRSYLKIKWFIWPEKDNTEPRKGK